MKLTVFQDTLRCGLSDNRQRFGETFYLHLKSVGFNQRVLPNCGKRLSVSLRQVRRQYLAVLQSAESLMSELYVQFERGFFVL